MFVLFSCFAEKEAEEFLSVRNLKLYSSLLHKIKMFNISWCRPLGRCSAVIKYSVKLQILDAREKTETSKFVCSGFLYCLFLLFKNYHENLTRLIFYGAI